MNCVGLVANITFSSISLYQYSTIIDLVSWSQTVYFAATLWRVVLNMILSQYLISRYKHHHMNRIIEIKLNQTLGPYYLCKKIKLRNSSKSSLIFGHFKKFLNLVKADIFPEGSGWHTYSWKGGIHGPFLPSVVLFYLFLSFCQKRQHFS